MSARALAAALSMSCARPPAVAPAVAGSAAEALGLEACAAGGGRGTIEIPEPTCEQELRGWVPWE